MNFIIEQGKEYFQGKEYGKAINLISSSIQDISDELKGQAYDLLASAFFQIQEYDEALDNYQKAIDTNDEIPEYYISKAAALRKLNKDDEAIDCLERAQSKKEDPAINFNLLEISKDEHEREAQVLKISEFEKFNRDYDKYGGIVPLFMKPNDERPDHVFKKEDELIEKIHSEVIEEWDEHLSEILRLIEYRELKLKNHGYLLKEQNIKLIGIVKKFIINFKLIDKNIKLKEVKEKIREKFISLMKQIKQQEDLCFEAIDFLLNTLEDDLCEEEDDRLVSYYKNWNSFLEIKAEIISPRVETFNIDKANMEIIILNSKRESIVFVDARFISHFNPSKTMKTVEKLSQNKKLSENDKRIIFHTFWFCCLRVLLTCETGIDIDLYLKFRRAITFIYNEIESELILKVPSEEIERVTLSILKKYNKMFDVKFLAENKKKMINWNCEEFKKYCLEKMDRDLAEIFKEEKYIDIILSSNTSEEQNEFRKDFDCKDTFEDQIAEILILIFYHFRKPCQLNHELLFRAFVELAAESEETLSGKESFFKHYCESKKPKKEGFKEKILSFFF